LQVKLPNANLAQLEAVVDQQIRELERLSASGDEEARHKLDHIRLKMGETPSWDFLLEESARVITLQKTHLFKAVDARFKGFFEKHPNSGILSFSWGIYDRADCGDYNYTPDNWDIEGLQIDIDDDYWEEHCQITDWGQEFEASTLISHLKGECDCQQLGRVYLGDTLISEKPDPTCYIGSFDWLEESQRQALRSALEDAIPLWEMLDKTDRALIRQYHIDFIYRPEKGLMSRERIGEQHEYHS